MYVVRSGVAGGADYAVARLSRKALRAGGAAYCLRKLAEASAAAAAELDHAWPHAPLDLEAARAALRAAPATAAEDEGGAAHEEL